MDRQQCHSCGEDAKSLCSGCRIVCFCSKECQVSAWPSHKAKCKAAKNEAKQYLGDMFHAAQEGNIAELRYYLEKYPATVNMVYSRNFGFMTVSGYALDSAAGQGLYFISYSQTKEKVKVVTFLWQIFLAVSHHSPSPDTELPTPREKVC